MKEKIYLLILGLSSVIGSYSQEIKTITNQDWNTLRSSGFFEADLAKSKNNPGGHAWYWGINAAHSSNSMALSIPYHFNGQILFGINFNALSNPDVYVRSSNVDGNGVWAKLLHSKGNHAIDGKLTAKEVEIKIVTGADFVFSEEYDLIPLADVETFIQEHKHLPDIPSEKQMQTDGLSLNEFQIKLLQKIEELTLYDIEQNKKIEAQHQRIEELEKIYK